MKYAKEFFTRFLFVLLLLLNITTSANESWTRIPVDDIASFKIPQTIEIQSPEYRSYLRQLNLPFLEPGYGKIICQQPGLNDACINGPTPHYFARVIFDTIHSDEDTGCILGTPIPFNQSDIKEFRDMLVEGMLQSAPRNQKYWDFSEGSIERYPTGECIHISYKRQLDTNPVVQGHFYYFFHKNMMYSLNIA